MRSSNGGLAYGTNGNPQTNIMQETYAVKMAENEARLKAEADAAPLIDQSHLAEMEASGVKFTRKDVIFTARDSTGQIVWLEKGSKTAGYWSEGCRSCRRRARRYCFAWRFSRFMALRSLRALGGMTISMPLSLA